MSRDLNRYETKFVRKKIQPRARVARAQKNGLPPPHKAVLLLWFVIIIIVHPLSVSL